MEPIQPGERSADGVHSRKAELVKKTREGLTPVADVSDCLPEDSLDFPQVRLPLTFARVHAPAFSCIIRGAQQC